MEQGSRLEINSLKGRQIVHVSKQEQRRRLTEVLRRAGFPLNMRCGGRGLCDGCVIELVSGSVSHATTGQGIAATDSPVAIRACEHHLDGESSTASIRLPVRAMLAYEPLVQTDFSINISYSHAPLHQRIEIPPAQILPTTNPSAALCDAIRGRLADGKPVEIDAPAVAQLAELPSAASLFASVEQRGSCWLVTNVAGASGPRPVAAAIDVGTTTVVVLLLDLIDGRILARAAAFNQQLHLGDDVVTRITLCSQNPDMLRQLQDAVNNRTIAPLLAAAMAEANVVPDQITCMTIAGNTTMLHIAAGVDPSSMGVAPFTPVFVEHRILRPRDFFTSPADGTSRETTIPCSPAAAIHLLPSAAAYIGADLTAGVVASGLLYDPGPSLLVDAGTNGEIILTHGGKLFGCATAAGPAFEGAGLSCGIRAGDGAIRCIQLAGEPFAVETEMIGQEKDLRPAGLCGSAYIDFLAQARRLGLLTPTGRFVREAFPTSSDHLMPWGKNDLAFRVACADGKRPIVISQVDIAHLLQAKAAIAAGILILLNQAALQPRQIRRLYLAGGFGTHMNSQHAIDCGMLPGFHAEQIQPVGNTALAGAYVAILDSSIVDELARIGRRMHVVELNLDPNFEATYIDQLALP